MSVASIAPWYGPGCSIVCRPDAHDPDAHERYGVTLERSRQGTPRIVRTGPLTVDLRAQTVTVNGQEIGLGPSQWLLLSHLARNLDTYCDREDLEVAIWGDGPVHTNAIRCLTARLRQSLGPACRHLIINGHRNRYGLRLRVLEPES